MSLARQKRQRAGGLSPRWSSRYSDSQYNRVSCFRPDSAVSLLDVRSPGCSPDVNVKNLLMFRVRIRVMDRASNFFTFKFWQQEEKLSDVNVRGGRMQNTSLRLPICCGSHRRSGMRLYPGPLERCWSLSNSLQLKAI